MSRVLIVLSGCGVFDGSETNEVILTLLHLEKGSVEYDLAAPNMKAYSDYNHYTNEEIKPSKRDVLSESARLVRGNVMPIQDVQASNYDGLIVPGGLGVVKNLSNFFTDDDNKGLNSEFEELAQSFIDDKKPVLLFCIAPLLATKLYPKGAVVTIGDDEELSSSINNSGLIHKSCKAENFVFDDTNNLITSPALSLIHI